MKTWSLCSEFVVFRQFGAKLKSEDTNSSDTLQSQTSIHVHTLPSKHAKTQESSPVEPSQKGAPTSIVRSGFKHGWIQEVSIIGRPPSPKASPTSIVRPGSESTHSKSSCFKSTCSKSTYSKSTYSKSTYSTSTYSKSTYSRRRALRR